MESVTGKTVSTEIPTTAPVIEIKSDYAEETNPLKKLYPPTEIISTEVILQQADYIKKRVEEAAFLNQREIHLDELIHEENRELLAQHGFIVSNNVDTNTARVAWA